MPFRPSNLRKWRPRTWAGWRPNGVGLQKPKHFSAMAKVAVANKRHPGFHKTDTIDYAIVLSGEIYALMDEGEVLLKAGDVLIQRGTNHAWSNRTEEPCCVAFVLIDAEPV